MKKLFIPIFLGVFLVSCASNKPEAWFKKQAIANGLTPMPSATIDAAEFAHQYSDNKAVWDKVFDWMKTQDLANLAPGKYPIDGDNAYASVTEIVDKPFEDTRWESHRKYIDLQYIIRGQEKIGVAPVKNADEITAPYNADKDVAHYRIDKADIELATPKYFFLFFPENAHRPNIKVNDEKVKKLVIKIHVAE